MLISWIFHCDFIVGLSKVLGHNKSPEQYQCTLVTDPTSLSNCTGGIKRRSSESHSPIYFCVNVYLHLDRVWFYGSACFPTSKTKVVEKQVLLILVPWSCHPNCETDSIFRMKLLLNKICESQKTAFGDILPPQKKKTAEATEHFTKQSYACAAFYLLFLQWNGKLSGFWEVFCFLLTVFCKFWCGSCNTAP